MEEDIDDLLDEVESKYCREKTPKSGKPKSGKTNISVEVKPSKSNGARSTRKKGDDDLNDMIKEICFVDEIDLTPNSSSKPARPESGKKKSQSERLPSGKKKCFSLFLGGSMASKGLCTVSEQRSCDKLRCTSCDFDVVAFDNFEWYQDCDYLFFRNNIPDFQRLKSKLTLKKGCRAYACQCTWRSITHLTEVHSDAKLKWVCGKHS